MLVNGQPQTLLPLNDRGLAYGDGLFETILVRDHKPALLQEHRQRLLRGCERLGLQLDQAAFDGELQQVLAAPLAKNAVLKIMLTRTAGGRGYRPGTSKANRIFTLHPVPDYSASKPETGITAFLCRQRLARQPALAGLKHLNRLEQVLASQEWPDGDVMEGLMLDTEGLVIEGTRSNVFVASANQLFTPGLQNCGVDGVLRAVLLAHFGSRVLVADITLEQLRKADEVFFCNSVFGIWPLKTLLVDAARWQFTPGSFTQQASACCLEVLR
jgi:4-amino-4-deoxychorismate lyase